MQTCGDPKSLKRDIDTLAKNKNSLSVAMKTLKKVTQEESKEFRKKIDKLKEEVEQLEKFKEKIQGASIKVGLANSTHFALLLWYC